MGNETTFLDLAHEEQELYLKIKNDVILLSSVTISDLQIKYSIGYAEAHKMLDLLAKEEIISSRNKNGRREVLKQH